MPTQDELAEKLYKEANREVKAYALVGIKNLLTQAHSDFIREARRDILSIKSGYFEDDEQSTVLNEVLALKVFSPKEEEKSE